MRPRKRNAPPIPDSAPKYQVIKRDPLGGEVVSQTDTIPEDQKKVVSARSDVDGAVGGEQPQEEVINRGTDIIDESHDQASSKVRGQNVNYNLYVDIAIS